MSRPSLLVHPAAADLQGDDSQPALLGLANAELDPLFWRSERLPTPSAWWGHVPFARWLIAVAQPRLLVELGTYAGVSYSAFCEAVQRASIGTRCIAVDTWEGDHQGGFYADDVFEDFRRFHDLRFAAFSTLLRSSFDTALAHVADGSVDLLHIDGLHTHDAVRHDYESWRPKLSERGIVLLHDVEVRRDDFGVWRLWAELREQYPSLTLLHGHGLGLLAVGSDVPDAVLRLCAFERDPSAAAWRARLARLGEWTIAEHERLAAQEESARATTAAAHRAEQAQLAMRQMAEAQQAAQAEAEHWRGYAAAADRGAAAWQQRAGIAEREAARWQGRAAEAECAVAHAEQQADAARRAEAETANGLAAAARAAAEWQQRTIDAERGRAAAEHAAAEWQFRAQEEEGLRRGAQAAAQDLLHRAERAEQAAAAASPDPALTAQIEQLQSERALLRESRSWRAAMALRALGRAVPLPLRLPAYRAARLAAAPLRMRARPDFRLRRAMRCIATSGLFDPAWYSREYPDVAAAGFDPVLHYAQYGAADRRNPSGAFEAAWYLDAYPDVAASGLNPLVHYMRHGRAEGRAIRPVALPLPAAPAAAEPPAPAASETMPPPDLAAPAPVMLQEVIDAAPVRDEVVPDQQTRRRERRRHLGLGLTLPATKVVVGIVTYDTPEEELRRALAAARVALDVPETGGTARVLILDNGAPTEAGAGETLVQRLAPCGNIGFGAGHNRLMAAAFADGADIYLAVNPDGMLHPDAVAALLRMLAASGFRALVEAMQFPEEHPKTYSPVNFDTPWASGACLAIPRSLYETVGGFDEGFFMYCEDVDLSWRARAAGFDVKICPVALFLHRVTNRQVTAAAQQRMLHAGRRLAIKWGGSDFAAHCARELAGLGEEVGYVDVEQVPAAQHGIADFAHLFHFSRARW